MNKSKNVTKTDRITFLGMIIFQLLMSFEENQIFSTPGEIFLNFFLSKIFSKFIAIVNCSSKFLSFEIYIVHFNILSRNVEKRRCVGNIQKKVKIKFLIQKLQKTKMAGDFLVLCQTLVVTKMTIRPPFTVPPEQLDKWDEDFENGYCEWKSNDIFSKSSKEDYRQFVIHLNAE